MLNSAYLPSPMTGIPHFNLTNLNAKDWLISDSIKIYAFWISRFDFQNRICNLSLDLGDLLNLAFFKKIWWHKSCHTVKCHRYFNEVGANLRELGTIAVSLQMWKSIKHPDFFKKYQMQPISQVQWHISNLILEFKMCHFRWIQSLVNLFAFKSVIV